MVACPFQIPAYEYDDPLTPRVRKCEFCFDRLAEGKAPACATACPEEAISFGRRENLLKMARERLIKPETAHRDKVLYLDHIFGETEAGGTSWLYLSSLPFQSLGFPMVPESAPPRLTEAIQHGIFKDFVPPLGLLGLLAVAMHALKDRNNTNDKTGDHQK